MSYFITESVQSPCWIFFALKWWFGEGAESKRWGGFNLYANQWVCLEGKGVSSSPSCFPIFLYGNDGGARLLKPDLRRASGEG